MSNIEVIAIRKLEDGRGQLGFVKIGKPKLHSDEGGYTCDLVIESNGLNKTRSCAGSDGVQALIMALKYVGSTIREFNSIQIAYADHLLWDGAPDDTQVGFLSF